MLVTAIHFFQVTILKDYFGLSNKVGTALFIPTMLAMIVFIPIVGKMLDKFKTHIIISLALLVTASSLILITLATSYINAIIYSIVFGINNAFTISLFGYILLINVSVSVTNPNGLGQGRCYGPTQGHVREKQASNCCGNANKHRWNIRMNHIGYTKKKVNWNKVSPVVSKRIERCT